ncbi:MAG: sugar phosphate isomerase/epimerase, partial [bacterium]|nr:sugar phosphate isomerase/epimerase [bacterium]
MSTSERSIRAANSRRDFLKLAATAGSGLSIAACAGNEPQTEVPAPVGQAFAAPLGVELYTVRNQLGDKAEETLRRLAEIGFVEIEHSWVDVKPMLTLLKDLGLRPVSVALNPAIVTGNWDAWDTPVADREENLGETAAEAKQAGADYFMFPYLLPEERGDLDFYRKLADQLNKAGEMAIQHDVLLCYHNHAFEFEPLEGISPFDILVERIDPKLAAFEIDVFWVAITGNNPVEVLRRLRGRAPLLHLKDLVKGAEPRYDEKVPPE